MQVVLIGSKLQAAAKREAARARRLELGRESVNRAQSSVSIANDLIVLNHFAAMGVPEFEIRPRENVFTFKGWLSLGRAVRKGEHGCALMTVAERAERDPETGVETVTGLRVTTYVFHISQTDVKEARS